MTTYNALGDRLRVERQSLYQRELMLDTVIQTTPLALVLTNDGDAVLYSNTAARQLFGDGRKLEGERFSRYLERGARAAARGHRSRRRHAVHARARRRAAGLSRVAAAFLLNALPHRLLLLKQLTREINSQEVATWKKVIRVIAHELNNSLAPISSLAHSGQILARAPPDPEQLSRVFATIEDRARHLAGFIEGYAQFAKLPQPRLAPVAWDVLLERLRVGRAVHARRHRRRSARASFDTAQIEQALINLLKNARESGSDAGDIELAVSRAARRLHHRSARSRARVHRRPRSRMRWCRSIRPRRPAPASGSRCAAKSSKPTAGACASPIARRRRHGHVVASGWS